MSQHFLLCLCVGSLFGVAGELPEVYTQAITAGTGASGFIVSLLRCITKVGKTPWNS